VRAKLGAGWYERSTRTMANGQTTMNIKKPLFATLLLLSGLAFNAAAADKAADKAAEPPAPAPAMGTEYTEKGADTCLMCHVEGGDFPVFAIFKTKHANRGDKRTPFAGCNAKPATARQEARRWRRRPGRDK